VLRLRSAAAVALVTVVAAACTAGQPPVRPSTTTTGQQSELPSPPPQVGQCRGLITREIILAPTDPRVPIPCDQPHGSETVFVADLPPKVAALSHRDATRLSVDFPGVSDAIEACDVAFEDYVGVVRISPDSVLESNLDWAFYIPTFDDWAKGARWMRCDAVTVPLNGVVTRGSTERLHGVLDRDPLPPAWRSCYRDAPAPPRLVFDFPASCDQPHAAEVLLRFQVNDPKVDELVTDRRALELHLATAFLPTCTERVAALVGLSPEALERRGDIKVDSRPVEIARWAAESNARRMRCIAITSQQTVGTVEDLGDRSLPRS
jgi:hypothetical protein